MVLPDAARCLADAVTAFVTVAVATFEERDGLQKCPGWFVRTSNQKCTRNRDLFRGNSNVDTSVAKTARPTRSPKMPVSHTESQKSSGMTGFRHAIALGIGARRNELEAIRWYREAAHHGDVISMANLGHLLCFGSLSVRDPKEGVRYLKRSATAGDKVGALNLARCYEGGVGVRKNARRAKELMENGNADGTD